MKTLEKFGIKFKNNKVLETALTHTSYANEHNLESYERLEFLGDAVLELLMSDYLYNITNLPEGKMSKMRSAYVCENALFEYAKEIHLKDFIKIGNGVNEANKSVIADVFEAVLGAIYLDLGIDSAKKYFDKLIVPYITKKSDFLNDYKSLLQELVQTDRKNLKYKLVNESGPAHNKEFVVDVMINNIKFGTGVGKSKKEAEQKAAEDAYKKQA